MIENLDVVQAAFLDELEKIGGIGSFLGGGYKALGQMVSPAAKGAKKVPGLFEEMGQLYRGGAKAGKPAKGGMWEGVKRVAAGRPGQVAAAIGVPVAGGVAASQLLDGGQRRY